MKTKKALFTTAIAAAGLGLASGAQAASVNDILRNIVTADGVAGTEQTFLFNDADQSVVIDSNSNGIFDAGDIVRGTLSFESISRFGGSTANLGTGGNNSLFGRFSVVVTDITVDGGNNGFVSFGYDASAFTDADVLFEFYESTDSVTIGDLTGTDAGFNAAAFTNAGASFWSTAGLTGDAASDYTFRIDSNLMAAIGYDVSNLAISSMMNLGAGEPIAVTDRVGLNWLTDPVGANIAGIGLFNNGLEVAGDGSIFDGSGELLASAATFRSKMIVTPVPASAWMAFGTLGLLGLGYYGKRRRDAVA